jgi:hypothetical protein
MTDTNAQPANQNESDWEHHLDFISRNMVCRMDLDQQRSGFLDNAI